jgi:hypothetical protein
MISGENTAKDTQQQRPDALKGIDECISQGYSGLSRDLVAAE